MTVDAGGSITVQTAVEGGMKRVGVRVAYKEKPAAEGGSTAGQPIECTHKYGLRKLALQDVVALREDRWLFGPVPLGGFPPLVSHPGTRSSPL